MNKMFKNRKLLLGSVGVLAILTGFVLAELNKPVELPPAPCQITSGSTETHSAFCALSAQELLKLVQSDATAASADKRIVSVELENRQAYRVLDKEVEPGKIEETIETTLGQHFTVHVTLKNGEKSSVVLTNIEMIKVRNALGERFIIGEVPPLTWGEWAAANWFFLLAGGTFASILLLGMAGKLPGKMGNAMRMRKSKAIRLDEKTAKKLTFANLAGYPNVKEDLADTVDFLREPQKFKKTTRIPRGVLMVGPPGTGKSLWARAIAGEAGVPFFFISGSDFVEMFVGVGAARVRDMFEEAKKNAPCIIFVDEIDAIGRHRGAGTGGGNDEREQTLNQLLVEMDGFDKKDGSAEPVIIIAATNRPDVLDPALLRPGRFDRQITVPNPDITDREPIIELYFQQHGGVEADVSAKDWAARTTNCSPADLNNLINEAAILRDKAGKPLIADEHMHQAWDKIQMGSPRKLSLTDAELRATSAHEGGHVFGAIYGGLDKFLRFDKVSITPRSNSLGVTILNALRDPVSMTYEQVLASLICLQGGREAELLMHGGDPSKVTSGCSNDIKRAAEAAHQALTQQGFGVFVDPVNLTAMAYDTNTPDPFLGKTMALGAGSSCSEETQRHIDQAAHKMISESAAAVAKILKEHGEEWVAVVNELYAKQTMSREEVYAVINAVRVKNGLEPLDGTAVFEVVDHPLEWTAITAQLAERETAAAI